MSAPTASATVSCSKTSSPNAAPYRLCRREAADRRRRCRQRHLPPHAESDSRVARACRRRRGRGVYGRRCNSSPPGPISWSPCGTRRTARSSPPSAATRPASPAWLSLADGTKFIAGGADKTIQIWDRAAASESPDVPIAPKSTITHTHGIRTVALSNDGKQILAGGDDNMLWSWDAATLKESASIGLAIPARSSRLRSRPTARASSPAASIARSANGAERRRHNACCRRADHASRRRTRR